MVRSIVPPPSQAKIPQRNNWGNDSSLEAGTGVVSPPTEEEICAPRPPRVGGSGSGVSDIIKRFNESKSGGDNGMLSLTTTKTPPPRRGYVVGDGKVAKSSLVTPDSASRTRRLRNNPAPSAATPMSHPVPETNGAAKASLVSPDAASRLRKNSSPSASTPMSHLVPETNPLTTPYDTTKRFDQSASTRHDRLSSSLASPNQESIIAHPRTTEAAKNARNGSRISGMIAAFEHTLTDKAIPASHTSFIPVNRMNQRRQNDFALSARVESAPVEAAPHGTGSSIERTSAAVMENASKHEYSSDFIPNGARTRYESSSKGELDTSRPTKGVESSLSGLNQSVRRSLSGAPGDNKPEQKALALPTAATYGQHDAGTSVRVAELPEAASSPNRTSSTAVHPNFGDLSPIKDANEGVTGKSSLSTEMEPTGDGLVSRIGPSLSTHFKLSETRHSSNSSSFQSRLLQFSKSIAKFSDATDAKPVSKEVDGKGGVVFSSEPMEETTESSYSVNGDSQVMPNDLSAGDVGQLDDWRMEDPTPLASLCDVSSEAPSPPEIDTDLSSHSTAISPSRVKMLRSKFDVAIATATSASSKAEISQEGFEVAASILAEESALDGQEEFLTVGLNVLAKERDRGLPPDQSISGLDVEEKVRSTTLPLRPLSLTLQARKPSNGDGPPLAPGCAVWKSSTARSTEENLNSIASTNGNELDAEEQFEPPKPIRMMPKTGVTTANGWDFLSPREDSRAPPKPEPSTYKLAPNPKDTGVSSKARKQRGPSCDDSQGACPLHKSAERICLAADDFSPMVPPGTQSRFALTDDVADNQAEDVPSRSNRARRDVGPVDLDITVEESMEVEKSLEHLASFERPSAEDRHGETAVAHPTESVGFEEVPEPDSRLFKLPPNPKDTKRPARSSKGRSGSMNESGLLEDVEGLSLSTRLDGPVPSSNRIQVTPTASRSPRSLSQTSPIWTAMDGSERVKRWRKFRRKQNDDLESSVDDFDCSASDQENPPDGMFSESSSDALRWNRSDPPVSRPRPAEVASSTKSLRRSPRSASSSSVMIEI